jgi:hypothetical protein
VGISNPNPDAEEVGVQLPNDPASGQGGAAHGGNSDTTEGFNSRSDSGALGTNAVIEVALIGSGEPIEDNDLHGAVVSLTCDALLNLDYTLDQLISSTDLFDVPALDLSEGLPT